MKSEKRRLDRWLGCALVATALWGVPVLHPHIHSVLPKRFCCHSGQEGSPVGVHRAAKAGEHEGRCIICFHLMVAGSADGFADGIDVVGPLVTTNAGPAEDLLLPTASWQATRGRSPPSGALS